MKNILCVLALAPAVVLAAAGHTGYAAYLSQVPAPPRNAQEAYAAVIINAQAAATGGRLIEPSTTFKNLQQKLADEGRLATAASNSSTPTGVTDEASAQALQRQLENMTPAEQMAWAQQMAGQMNSAMQPGALGAEDRAIITLLEQRQQGSMLRIEQQQRLLHDWTEASLRWDATHVRIEQDFYSALKQTPMQCSKTDNMDFAALKLLERFNAQHLAKVQEELKEGRALFERQRINAVDAAGFSDQLATRMGQAPSPLAQQGYAGARHDALRDIGGLLDMSWKLHEHAATWWHKSRDTSTARRCGGMGG